MTTTRTDTAAQTNKALGIPSVRSEASVRIRSVAAVCGA
jgi:hypothetical protein